MSKTRLTKRGWIVLVIIPSMLLSLLVAHWTRDVCWVGTDKPYSQFLGWGSCETWLNDMVGDLP